MIHVLFFCIIKVKLSYCHSQLLIDPVLKISLGHLSPSLLISAKSIYWHYKTEVVQYNSTMLHLKIKPNTGPLTAFSHLPGVEVEPVSTVDLDAACCGSWVQFCLYVNEFYQGQHPHLPVTSTSNVLNHSVLNKLSGSFAKGW